MTYFRFIAEVFVVYYQIVYLKYRGGSLQLIVYKVRIIVKTSVFEPRSLYMGGRL